MQATLDKQRQHQLAQEKRSEELHCQLKTGIEVAVLCHRDERLCAVLISIIRDHLTIAALLGEHLQALKFQQAGADLQLQDQSRTPTYI